MNNNWTDVVVNWRNGVVNLYNDFMVYTGFRDDPVYGAFVFVAVWFALGVTLEAMKSASRDGESAAVCLFHGFLALAWVSGIYWVLYTATSWLVS